MQHKETEETDKEKANDVPFDYLPDEIILLIFSFLEKKTLLLICSVSLLFNRLAGDNALWAPHRLSIDVINPTNQPEKKLYLQYSKLFKRNSIFREDKTNLYDSFINKCTQYRALFELPGNNYKANILNGHITFTDIQKQLIARRPPYYGYIRVCVVSTMQIGNTDDDSDIHLDHRQKIDRLLNDPSATNEFRVRDITNDFNQEFLSHHTLSNKLYRLQHYFDENELSYQQYCINYDLQSSTGVILFAHDAASIVQTCQMINQVPDSPPLIFIVTFDEKKYAEIMENLSNITSKFTTIAEVTCLNTDEKINGYWNKLEDTLHQLRLLGSLLAGMDEYDVSTSQACNMM